MRYSEIVGQLFYNISLTREQAEMVDVHFTSAAHHLLTIPLCEQQCQHQFHLLRHRAHLRAMMLIVFTCGDFSQACDPSLRGLESRHNWNPEINLVMPDPRMFNSMQRDGSIDIGEPYPSDFYIGLHRLNLSH